MSQVPTLRGRSSHSSRHGHQDEPDLVMQHTSPREVTLIRRLPWTQDLNPVHIMKYGSRMTELGSMHAVRW